jgi:hypothetical protein
MSKKVSCKIIRYIYILPIKCIFWALINSEVTHVRCTLLSKTAHCFIFGGGGGWIYNRISIVQAEDCRGSLPLLQTSARMVPTSG